MPEIQLGSHTVRSHGAKVARIHMHDWLILLLLIVIEVILNVVEPFHRFVGEHMMEDLKYPLKDNTVPFWAVPVCFLGGTNRICLIVSVISMMTGIDELHFSNNFDQLEQLIAIVLPFAIMLVYYFIRKDVYDLHHAILGNFSSPLILLALLDVSMVG